MGNTLTSFTKAVKDADAAACPTVQGATEAIEDATVTTEDKIATGATGATEPTTSNLDHTRGTVVKEQRSAEVLGAEETSTKDSDSVEDPRNQLGQYLLLNEVVPHNKLGQYLLLNPRFPPCASSTKSSLDRIFEDFVAYAEDAFFIYPLLKKKEWIRLDVLESYLKDFALDGVMVHDGVKFHSLAVEKAALSRPCIQIFQRKSSLLHKRLPSFSYQQFQFPHKPRKQLQSGFVTFRKHNLMVAKLEDFTSEFFSYPIGSPNGFPVIAEMPLGCSPTISFFRPAASRVFTGKRKREGTCLDNNNKKRKFVGRHTPYGGMGIGEATTVGQDPRNTQCRPIPRQLEEVIEMMVPELEANLKEIGGAPFRVETRTTVEYKIYAHKSFKTRANPGGRYHQRALRSDGTRDHEDRRRDRRRLVARRAREAEQRAQEEAAALRRREEQAHARAQRRERRSQNVQHERSPRAQRQERTSRNANSWNGPQHAWSDKRWVRVSVEDEDVAMIDWENPEFSYDPRPSKEEIMEGKKQHRLVERNTMKENTLVVTFTIGADRYLQFSVKRSASAEPIASEKFLQTHGTATVLHCGDEIDNQLPSEGFLYHGVPDLEGGVSMAFVFRVGYQAMDVDEETHKQIVNDSIEEKLKLPCEYKNAPFANRQEAFESMDEVIQEFIKDQGETLRVEMLNELKKYFQFIE